MSQSFVFITGSCLGYHEKGNKDCKSCSISDKCKRITGNATLRDKIRGICKRNSSDVKRCLNMLDSDDRYEQLSIF